MVVTSLRLINFRSYRDASIRFGPHLNVVVGENATGKTNLLEGAWFALHGSSPRTRWEEKLITWGQRFTRVELEVDVPGVGPQTVEIGYAPRQGKRFRWGGTDITSLDDLRSRSQVFIFVPESLLLVKGSPARRRAHIDAFAVTVDTRYAVAARELQAALRQRNAQLAAVGAGAPETTLDPWDAQFAHAAVELGRRRRDLVGELAEGFAVCAAALAPDDSRYALELVSQLTTTAYDESALLEELAARRPGEVARGLSLYGPHRDDVRFLEVTASDCATSAAAGAKRELPRGGRDLRLFGSQGEQRAAILALLLAEQRLAAARTGERGTLFLDDVMSELDDARRRLLVHMLATAGQAIITTTNRQYFTEEELALATIVELPVEGSIAAPEALPPEDAAGPAPPDMDAL